VGHGAVQVSPPGQIAENGQIFGFELAGGELSQLDALDRAGGTKDAPEGKWR
jgi:hypothetical protein